MLKIPEPVETTNLKVRVSAATKKDLDIYVEYLKTKQPHATADVVVETIINKVIPRVGKEAKSFNDFKKSLLKS